MSRVSRISKELDRGDRAALHLEVEVVGSGFVWFFFLGGGRLFLTSLYLGVRQERNRGGDV